MRHRTSRRLAGLQLADILCRNWWVLLLRGIIAVTFGALVLLRTGLPFSVLAGTYATADGVLGVGTAIGESPGRAYWWVLLCRGLAGVVVGMLMFFVLPRTPSAILGCFAAWTTTTGALDMLTAYYLRRKLGAEWLLVLGGIASVGFGVLLMASLDAPVPVVFRLIAGYAIVLGIILVSLAFRARSAPMPSV